MGLSRARRGADFVFLSLGGSRHPSALPRSVPLAALEQPGTQPSSPDLAHSQEMAVWIVTQSPLAEPRRSAHRPLLRLIPWVIVAIGWIAITLVCVAAYYASVLPNPREAMILHMPPNLTILARGGEFIAERGMRRAYVPYKNIPPHLVKAVLATEDRRFLSRRLRPHRPCQGGKCKLAGRRGGAGWLDDHAAARQELVSSPEPELGAQGRGVHIGTLARAPVHEAGDFGALSEPGLFRRRQLRDRRRCSFLFRKGTAGHHLGRSGPARQALSKAPSYYSPTANLSRARTRAKEILRLLAETDQIDINQYAEAAASPPELKVLPSKPGFGFVADWVAEVTPMLTGESSRNLTVGNDRRCGSAAYGAQSGGNRDAHQGPHRARFGSRGAFAHAGWCGEGDVSGGAITRKANSTGRCGPCGSRAPLSSLSSI